MEDIKLSSWLILGGKSDFRNMQWIRGDELLEESDTTYSIISPTRLATMNVETYILVWGDSSVTIII